MRIRMWAAGLGLSAFLGAQAPTPAPPLSVHRVADMKCGTVLLRNGAASFTLTPEGTRNMLGDINPGPGVVSPAILEVQGPPRQKFIARVDSDTARLTMGTARPLILRTFTISPVDQQYEFDATGRARIQVGATVDLPERPPVGLYANPQLTLRVEMPGAPPAFTTFSASVLVLANIKMTQTSALSFGGIVAGAQGGRVMMLPSGLRKLLEGADLLLRGGESSGAGAFQLDGLLPGNLAITLPSGMVYLNGPGTPLGLQDFTWAWAEGSQEPQSPDTKSTWVDGGPRRLFIGGTLRINPDQAPGVYTGTYEISVNYN